MKFKSLQKGFALVLAILTITVGIPFSAFAQSEGSIVVTFAPGTDDTVGETVTNSYDAETIDYWKEDIENGDATAQEFFGGSISGVTADHRLGGGNQADGTLDGERHQQAQCHQAPQYAGDPAGRFLQAQAQHQHRQHHPAGHHTQIEKVQKNRDHIISLPARSNGAEPPYLPRTVSADGQRQR